MCTFNGSRFLRAQLESIAAQDKLPDELVVCDDRSSDNCSEILREFSQRARFPVRLVINDENLGATKNFEKAISLCQGSLIAFCDQDDVWIPEKLGRLSSALEQDPSLGGVFSDALLIDADSFPTGRRLWQVLGLTFEHPDRFDRDAAIKLLLKHDVVTGATLMIRSSVRQLLSPIPELWVHDGWITWMLVLYSRLSFVSEPLVRYRLHPDQQLGVGHLNWADKIRSPSSEDRRMLESVGRQFEALRDRWVACPGADFASYLGMIENKITFFRRRCRLPDGFVQRACSVLSCSPSYQRYARGIRSMRADLFLSNHRGGRGA